MGRSLKSPRRGDIVTVAVSGDYGKPRPALIVQSDAFDELPSVMVVRLTSELHDWPAFRITIEPTPENGLRTTSQAMIDKATAVPRTKIGAVIGHADSATMRVIRNALIKFLTLDEEP